jgi:hypothetical protein
MLTIKDLPVAKSLGSKEMAAVSGGARNTIGDFNQYQDSDQKAGKGGVNGNQQIGVFTPTAVALDLHDFGNVSNFSKPKAMRF